MKIAPQVRMNAIGPRAAVAAPVREGSSASVAVHTSRNSGAAHKVAPTVQLTSWPIEGFEDFGGGSGVVAASGIAHSSWRQHHSVVACSADARVCRR